MNRRKRFGQGAPAALAGLLLAGAGLAALARPAQAEVQIEGTRFVYTAADRDISIGLRNLAKATPALVQVWLDDGADGAAPGQARAPFSLTPPMFRLDAGRAQRLRLLYTGEPLPADRESLFWLNVLEVPPQPDPALADERNVLQLAVRSRLKIFYRPPSLPGDAAQAGAALTWRIGQDRETGAPRLQVHNASAFHVSLGAVAVDIAGAEVSVGDGLVPPGATVDIALRQMPAVRSGPLTVTYTYLDDYGAERSVRAAVTP